MFDKDPQLPEDIFAGTDDVPLAKGGPSGSAAIPAPKPPTSAARAVPAPTNPPRVARRDPGEVGKKPLPPGLDPDDQSAPPPDLSLPSVPGRKGAAPGRPRARHGGKKLVMILVLAGLVVLAAALLASLILRSKQAVTPTREDTTRDVTDVRTPIEDVVETTTPPPSMSPSVSTDVDSTSETPPPPPPRDSDRDGLTDDEEAALGTSSRSDRKSVV